MYAAKLNSDQWCLEMCMIFHFQRSAFDFYLLCSLPFRLLNKNDASFSVNGVEYAFGAIEYPASGIFEVEPRQCPGYKFKKSIFIGTTFLNPFQIKELMKLKAENYYGYTYHLLAKNCNHFSEDVCHKLTGISIPKWVNRLAKLGSLSISH